MPISMHHLLMGKELHNERVDDITGAMLNTIGQVSQCNPCVHSLQSQKPNHI